MTGQLSHPGTALVTGANRGIGLELTRQYAAAGWRVLACCRAPAEARALRELTGVGTAVAVYALDVTAAPARVALARALEGVAIDVLLHNAGVYGPNGVAFGRGTDEAAWIEVLRVNTFAPLKLTELLIDNVAASAQRKIGVISSAMGSIGDNGYGGAYLYRSSKAALNAVARSMAMDLRSREVTVVALSPGWVRTDMGGNKAPLSVADAARGLRQVLAALTLADSGSFIDYDGTRLSW